MSEAVEMTFPLYTGTITPSTLREIQLSVLNNRGATIDIWDEDKMFVESGYVVAGGLGANELAVPFEDFFNDDGTIIANYIDNHMTLFRSNDAHIKLGLWMPAGDEVVILDCVMVLTHIENAMQWGRMNDQLAIFDLDNSEEIYLPTTTVQPYNEWAEQMKRYGVDPGSITYAEWKRIVLNVAA